MEDPDKQEKSRDLHGRWTKGHSGNVLGRPKGKTMKEWAREYLARMTDEERDEFMEGMPKDKIWAMAEGNPDSKTDVTSKGNAIQSAVLPEVLAEADRLLKEKLKQSHDS